MSLNDYSITDLQEALKNKKAKIAELPAYERLNECIGGPVGTWEVYTEGDAEARTRKHLGKHYGHIVNIAKNLAPLAYYGLNFIKISDVDITNHKNVSVKIELPDYANRASIDNKSYVDRWLHGSKRSGVVDYDIKIAEGTFGQFAIVKK